jgi:hypothetical protein
MEGTTGPAVAIMAIYSLPDPVMRRIDLEHCQIDNNGTYWHAKREVGQPQLQLEDCQDDTSCILFKTTSRRSDNITIYRSTQVCKHA